MSIIDSYLDQSNKAPRKLHKKSIINEVFDRVVIINLRRSLSRLIRTTIQLRSYNIEYEIFDAVDGKQEQILSKHNEILKRPLTHPLEIKKGEKLLQKPGEYAYLLTWQKLLSESMIKKVQRLLVFEDDILLSNNFETRVRRWLREDLPDNTKIWLFGASQLPKLRNPIDSNRNSYRPNLTDGSFAIGIDQDVFPILLEEIEKFNAPLDSGPLRSLYRDSRFKDRAFVSWPNLIIADVANSCIRESKELEKVAQQLEWDLSDFSSAYKKRNLSIAITLYITDLSTDIANLKYLKEDPSIIWTIIIITKNKISDKEERCTKIFSVIEKEKLAFFEIYRSPISSLKLAMEVSELIIKKTKKHYDRIFFYDLSLNLHDNLLHALSALV